MSRITRAIAQPLHAAKPDTRRRRPGGARPPPPQRKYDTPLTYSS
ncbi:type III secretion system protein, partial [Burkholderia pseudomallei]